jgi:hypothetical protein
MLPNKHPNDMSGTAKACFSTLGPQPHQESCTNQHWLRLQTTPQVHRKLCPEGFYQEERGVLQPTGLANPRGGWTTGVRPMTPARPQHWLTSTASIC